MRNFDMTEDMDPLVVRKGSPLKIELVPASSWGDNLRSRMTRAQWDRVRRNQYRVADYQCEICGQKGTSQGFDWPVECHEVWEYDDATRVQKLVRLIALCPRCHQTKHFGLAELRGQRGQALAHLMSINGWTTEQAEQHVKEAFALWHVRSQHPWTLDTTYLKDRNITLNEDPNG